MIDMSLQVCEVKFNGNVVGILQSIDLENDILNVPTLRSGQHLNLSMGSTLTLKMLMTRDQKVLYAVMQRLMRESTLSVSMHDGTSYLIKGVHTLTEETLRQFAEKKHADHEVTFVFNQASLEAMKERKNVKA